MILLQLNDQIRELDADRKIGHLFKISSRKDDHQINWFKLWVAFENAQIIDSLPLNIVKDPPFERKSFLLKISKTWAELEEIAKQMAKKYLADREFDDPKDRRFGDKAKELKDKR